MIKAVIRAIVSWFTTVRIKQSAKPGVLFVKMPTGHWVRLEVYRV